MTSRFKRKDRHLSEVPYESMQMPREMLLASTVEDMVYGPCRWCRRTHRWSIVDGRLTVDGKEVDLA